MSTPAVRAPISARSPDRGLRHLGCGLGMETLDSIPGLVAPVFAPHAPGGEATGVVGRFAADVRTAVPPLRPARSPHNPPNAPVGGCRQRGIPLSFLSFFEGQAPRWG